MTYLMFKILEEVALTTVTSVGFSLLVFYTVRLQGSFFIVWLVFLLTQLVGIGEWCQPETLVTTLHSIICCQQKRECAVCSSGL